MLPTLPFFIAHVIVAPLYPDDPDWALVYWGVASLGVIVCYVLLAAVYERWRADQIRRNGTATVEKDLREPS